MRCTARYPHWAISSTHSLVVVLLWWFARRRTFSSMSVLANFGLLTAAAIGLAFLADVLLAPALLTWLVEDSR